MATIHKISVNSKATPIFPPANIVPVKKVKLNNTKAIGKKPLRCESGVSVKGDSACALIFNTPTIQLKFLSAVLQELCRFFNA